jgi:antitoxin component of MazEF toxin-antitoxin module
MEINDRPDDGSEENGEGTTSQRLQHTLEELIAQITLENLHGEFDFGKPQGREVE